MAVFFKITTKKWIFTTQTDFVGKDQRGSKRPLCGDPRTVMGILSEA